MKIGLYFGSFNPIHHGHLIIAAHLVGNTELNQVWFVVSPQNPFKSSANLLNEYQRLDLVHKAITDDDSLRICDIEFHLPRPSYTIDSLTYISEKYPQHEFFIIIGGDSFQNLNKWKNASVLMNEYQFYVYKRPGFLLPENIPSNIKILEAPLLDISSTYIRKLIKEGKTIRYLVPDVVRKEIEQNGFYK